MCVFNATECCFIMINAPYLPIPYWIVDGKLLVRKTVITPCIRPVSFWAAADVTHSRRSRKVNVFYSSSYCAVLLTLTGEHSQRFVYVCCRDKSHFTYICDVFFVRCRRSRSTHLFSITRRQLQWKCWHVFRHKKRIKVKDMLFWRRAVMLKICVICELRHLCPCSIHITTAANFSL